MNVLVIGGTGFIGKYLVNRLLTGGYTVFCLVRSQEKAKPLEEQGVCCIIGDVTDINSLEKIPVSEIDIIIHLAAMGHVSASSEEAYQQFVSINEHGTNNLLSVFKNSERLKKFIHFSSTAAMGHIGIPILNEQSVPNPVTPYQKSKYRSEVIVEEAFRKEKMPTIIFRPCMVYGPGGYGEFYKFCKLMKKGIFPKVGMGKNLTPLVYVTDVVNAVMHVIDKGVAGETYIVASEQSIELDQMHNFIMDALEVKAPYIYVPAKVALLAAWVLEKMFGLLKKEPIVSLQNMKSTITDRTFDISKIKGIGYQQETAFEVGIRNTVNWYKSQGRI